LPMPGGLGTFYEEVKKCAVYVPTNVVKEP